MVLGVFGLDPERLLDGSLHLYQTIVVVRGPGSCLLRVGVFRRQAHGGSGRAAYLIELRWGCSIHEVRLPSQGLGQARLCFCKHRPLPLSFAGAQLLPCSMPGGTGSQLTFFKQNAIVPSLQGQMVQQSNTHHSPTNDHYS